MRNLNKFITGTNYKAYVTEGNVETVEYENVIVKVVRDSVNEYEVTFNRNDRTYSYKCQSQKEVIESIKNDIAYHDNEMTLDEQLETKEFKDLTVDPDDAEYKKERLEHQRINFEYNQMVNDITKENAATEESENEFAEFEKSLNETEEYKEVISANNAHMSKPDRLQAAISRAFGTAATILNSNERYVLVRYSKNGSAEFATPIHDWDSVSLGHYFTAWGVDEYDWSNKEFKKVRDRAIADYYERI